MIFSFPDISSLFEIHDDSVNTIIIENKHLLVSVVADITNQIEGLPGKAKVLKETGESVAFPKFVEIITSIVPFEINKKSLVTKILTAIEKESLTGECYEKTMYLLAEIERHFMAVSSSLDCNITFPKITASGIIKSMGVEIVDDYCNISEKIIDYFELVREFDCEKIFFTVNFRCFIDDDEVELFMKTAIDHQIKLIMLESVEYEKIKYENRLIIDKDLCEF